MCYLLCLQTRLLAFGQEQGQAAHRGPVFEVEDFGQRTQCNCISGFLGGADRGRDQQQLGNNFKATLRLKCEKYEDLDPLWRSQRLHVECLSNQTELTLSCKIENVDDARQSHEQRLDPKIYCILRG